MSGTGTSPCDIAYRARPYVCGVLGRWDPAVLRRLQLAAPTGVREVHSSPRAVLLASATPARWRSGATRGYLWGPLAGGALPTSWRDAAERRLAAGLVVTDGEAMLHADALGMQDVYVRRLGDATYFSVRVEALLELDDVPLHTDWSAWADILAITCPLGDATPFAEVRRLAAATALRTGPESVERVSFEPSWLATEPNTRTTPADAVDLVARHVRRSAGTAIPLTGGWDSRLLALLAHRGGQRPTAWTTSKDDGYDRDLELARPVAEALRMPHHVVVPGPEAWLDEHRAVWRRLGHQTNLHIWMMPLIRMLHRRPNVFLDGLAGDLLFKGSSFARWDAVAAPTAEQRRGLIWDGLEQRRLRRRHLLAPGVAAELEEMSRASFDRAAARFDGHPDATTLSVLHTRTARAIALSPQWLLAPEVEVQLPFVHPDVMTTAMSIPIERKAGGDFYRDMMFAANPAVAGLPSTNDGPALGRTGYMRQRSDRALDTLASSIRARPEVARMLGPEMRRALKDPDGLALIGRTRAGLRVLQWAGMLADWRDAYGSRLADGGLKLPKAA
jgi:asparagine synthetase B (glutamine-hydrolysing)